MSKMQFERAETSWLTFADGDTGFGKRVITIEDDGRITLNHHSEDGQYPIHFTKDEWKEMRSHFDYRDMPK